MNSETPLTRRGWLAAIGGCAGVGAVAGFAAKMLTRGSLGTPLPPLVLPPNVGGLTATRLQGLHARYSALRAARGVAAMRAKIVADLRSFAGHQEWQEIITAWVELGGWADAADLLIDASEIADVQVRRSAAAVLSTRPTGLLLANGCGPRIIRLAQLEVDPLAAEYWRDLRRMLGI